jgi:hypothetical protein
VLKLKADMRRLLLQLCFVLLACAPVGAEETVQVKATGVGATPGEAEKAALVNAVQQAVGLFLDNETLLQNEQIIYDKILSVSDGYVSKMDVLLPTRKRPSDGLFETTINATVEKDKLGSELRKQRILISPTDGQNAWAEAATRITDAQDGIAMLEKHLPEIQTRLLSARLIAGKSTANGEAVRPEVRPDPSTGMAICGWNIEVSYDRDAYYHQALPLLQKCFGALAERQEGDFVLHCSFSPSVHVGYPPATAESAFVGTPWRLYSAKDLPPRVFVERDQFKVALNVSADRSRQQLQFAIYTLSRGPYGAWLTKLQEPLALRIALLTNDGKTIREDTVGLEQTLRLPTNSEHQYNNYRKPTTNIPVDAIAVRVIAPNLGYTLPQEVYGPSFWFTPDFAAAQHFLNYNALTDNLVLHYEASLDPEDLKNIKSVQFSFVPENKNR